MNIFKKKVTLKAYVFPKLRTPKDVVRWMFRKSHLRRLLDRQDGKRVQTLFNINDSTLTMFIDLLSWMSWKKSLLVTCKIFRLFVNTLTTDDKYSLLSKDNLIQPIQMILCKKFFFSELSWAFLRSTSRFEHFQKKMTLIAYVF